MMTKIYKLGNIFSIIILVVIHLNCEGRFSDYSFELQNGYSFMRWRGDGFGKEIQDANKETIIAYVGAFNTKGNLIFGYSEKPVKYYPKTEYNQEYFIIDTKNHTINKGLSKTEWFDVISQYGINKSPVLYRPNRFWGITKLFFQRGIMIDKQDNKFLKSTKKTRILTEEKQNSYNLIDINTADAELLEKLDSVGPITAAKICYEREKNGPFHALEEVASRVKEINLKVISKWEGKAFCGQQ